MAKTQQGAAKDVTNTANGQLAISEDLYPNKLFPRLTGAGDVAAGRGAGDYSGASNAYTDMATTGGFSDADKNAYLNRATSGVKNTYDVLGEQARLNGMRTGASNTGAVLSQMARQGSQAQAEALNNAQVGLHQQVNQNRLAGAGGLGGLYGINEGAQGQANQQYLQGVGGYTGNLNDINRTKLGDVGQYQSSVLSPVLDPLSQISQIGANSAKLASGFGWM